MAINIHASNDNSCIVFEGQVGADIQNEDLNKRVGDIVKRALEKTHQAAYKKIKFDSISVEVDSGAVAVYLIAQGEKTAVAFAGKADKKLVDSLPEITATFVLEKDKAKTVEQLFKNNAPIRYEGARLETKEVKEVKTLPEPAGINTLKKEGPRGFSLIRIIKRFFSYYFTLLPNSARMIHNSLQQIELEDIRSHYLGLMKDTSKWIESMKNDYPLLGTLYSDKELKVIYEDQLFKVVNQNLITEGFGPIVPETELVVFRAQRALDESTFENLKEVLDEIQPEHMPVENFAQIAVTNENRDLLKGAWTSLFNSYIEKGNLSGVHETKGAARSEQARWAERLLLAQEVLEAIPKAKRPVDVDALVAKLDLKALNQLVLDEGVLNSKPVQQQHVFAALVKEELNRFFFVDFENLDAPGKPLDGLLLASVLAQSSPSSLKTHKPLSSANFIASLIDRYKEEKNLTIDDADVVLPIDKETLEKIYFQEAEKLARDLYGFTDAQIDDLRAQRTQAGEKKKGKKTAALSFDEQQVLFSDKALAEVQGGYNHPSKVSNTILVDLMTVTKLITVPKGRVLSEQEQADLLKAMDALSAHKNLASLLSVFSLNEESSKLVELVPSIVRRFVEVKPNFRLPLGISEQAMSLVIGYQKMMAQHNTLSVPLAKAEELLKKNPDEVKESEKLTYGEVGKISKLARYKKEITEIAAKAPFDLFEQLGFKQFSGELAVVKQQAETAKTLMDQLEGVLLDAFRDHHQDGDIFAHVASKKEQWTGRKLSGEEGLTARIIDYGLTHGMKAYIDEGTLFVSQLNAGVGLNDVLPISLYETFVSDVWRIDVSKLVPKACYAALEKAYGANWQEVVQNEYREIEKSIHKNIDKQFEGIKNDQPRRVEAGLSDYHGLVNLFGGMGGRKVLPHLAEHEQDFRQIHDEFFDGVPKNATQICSEFVSVATLAALMELNKRLADKIGGTSFAAIDRTGLDADVIAYLDKEHHKPEGDRETLTSLKMVEYARKKLHKVLTKQGLDAELIIRVNDEEIFDLPYDKRERMGLIHPGRMVTILEKAGCATRLEKPALFNKLIKLK